MTDGILLLPSGVYISPDVKAKFKSKGFVDFYVDDGNGIWAEASKHSGVIEQSFDSVTFPFLFTFLYLLLDCLPPHA